MNSTKGRCVLVAILALAAAVSARGAVSLPDSDGRTYTISSVSRVHAKGYRRNPHRKADWKSFLPPIGSFAAFIQAAPPNTFDLRPRLTRIENQGQCGSCWAFSLTATHRDGHALAGQDPGRLSQEWLVDNSPEAGGCNGGDFDSANDFVGPKGGQPLWSACPYRSGRGRCPKKTPFAAHIAGWHMLGRKGHQPSALEIENYMEASGKPVSVVVAAGAGEWEMYQSGIYNGCVMAQVDHMINIVGWDNEGAAFGPDGNLPPGKGVWILRNSWGTSWGEKGYMRSRMTDSKGQRCNALASEAAFFDF